MCGEEGVCAFVEQEAGEIPFTGQQGVYGGSLPSSVPGVDVGAWVLQDGAGVVGDGGGVVWVLGAEVEKGFVVLRESGGGDTTREEAVEERFVVPGDAGG